MQQTNPGQPGVLSFWRCTNACDNRHPLLQSSRRCRAPLWSPTPCPMPMARCIWGIWWATSKLIFGCVRDVCAASACTMCVPTTPTVRRSCWRQKKPGSRRRPSSLASKKAMSAISPRLAWPLTTTTPPIRRPTARSPSRFTQNYLPQATSANAAWRSFMTQPKACFCPTATSRAPAPTARRPISTVTIAKSAAQPTAPRI